MSIARAAVLVLAMTTIASGAPSGSARWVALSEPMAHRMVPTSDLPTVEREWTMSLRNLDHVFAAVKKIKRFLNRVILTTRASRSQRYAGSD